MKRVSGNTLPRELMDVTGVPEVIICKVLWASFNSFIQVKKLLKDMKGYTHYQMDFFLYNFLTVPTSIYLTSDVWPEHRLGTQQDAAEFYQQLIQTLLDKGRRYVLVLLHFQLSMFCTFGHSSCSIEKFSVYKKRWVSPSKLISETIC